MFHKAKACILGCAGAVAMLAGFGIDYSNAQGSGAGATSLTTATQPARTTQPGRAAQAAAPAAPVAQNHAPSGGKPYYIEFRARNALSYGHTFSVIARVGEKLTKKNVHGLHPATDSVVPWMIGHLIPVVSEHGWSDGDIEDQYIIAKYRIYLTAAEHKKLMEHVVKLKESSPTWHAALYNCNAYVRRHCGGLGVAACRQVHHAEARRST